MSGNALMANVAPPDVVRIGVISDTHGLVRPEVADLLQGVDRIIHAGDIDQPNVLSLLGKIAPVLAVRGNNDRGDWALALPLTEWIAIGSHAVFALHDLSSLDIDPAAAGIAVVISGHSHRPLINEHEGVLYMNPGSAGPRRFNLPISLAILELHDGHLKARLEYIPI